VLVRSQNGYEANNPKLLVVIRPVPQRAFRVRQGPVAVVFDYLIREYHHRVERIDVGLLDDWSYAERPIRGGVQLSNHASGTAVDLNAERHPLGTDPHRQFSAAQLAQIDRILDELHGTVRYGGNYSGRLDPMHFEIVKPERLVAEVADQLRKARRPAPPRPPAVRPTPTPVRKDTMDTQQVYDHVELTFQALAYGDGRAVPPENDRHQACLKVINYKLDLVLEQLAALKAKP
jgi:hypothetical protein